MGLRMVNVVHPKTGSTTTAREHSDGTWVTPDGCVVNLARQDKGGTLLAFFVLLIGITWLINFLRLFQQPIN